MKDAECPYCGAEIEISHEDGYGLEEGTIFNQECPRCWMVFAFTTSVSYYYDTKQAPCLNGGEHKFKRTVTFPAEFARMRCSVCGEERPLP